MRSLEPVNLLMKLLPVRTLSFRRLPLLGGGVSVLARTEEGRNRTKEVQGRDSIRAAAHIRILASKFTSCRNLFFASFVTPSVVAQWRML